MRTARNKDGRWEAQRVLRHNSHRRPHAGLLEAKVDRHRYVFGPGPSRGLTELGEMVFARKDAALRIEPLHFPFAPLCPATWEDEDEQIEPVEGGGLNFRAKCVQHPGEKRVGDFLRSPASLVSHALDRVGVRFHPVLESPLRLVDFCDVFGCRRCVGQVGLREPIGLTFLLRAHRIGDFVIFVEKMG